MKKDKNTNYALEAILIAILFFALFVSNIYTRIVISLIMIIYMIITCKLLKKRNILSIHSKQVMLLMILIGIIYLSVFYLMGLYFGYYNASVKLTWWSLCCYIIPIAIIVISSEIVRNVLLVEKSKLSKTLVAIAMIFVDLLLYVNIYEIGSFKNMVDIVSFTIFASISSNILYNYISARYGAKPVIAFRLITILYVYIIPIIPNVQLVIRCFLRIIYPYLIYILLEYSYAKATFVKAYDNNKKNIIVVSVLIIVMTILVMLISCKFRYGMLVVASESMTGAINKGDAVIFESYEDQKIQGGEIIIFEKNNTRIIHRVMDIQQVNGENRYNTKGDKNEHPDEGYIIDDQIIGIAKIRLYYIGWPSVLLREAFL